MVRASLACVWHLISLDWMWDWHRQIDSFSLLLFVHIVHYEEQTSMKNVHCRCQNASRNLYLKNEHIIICPMSDNVIYCE